MLWVLLQDYKKYQIPAFGYWDFSDDLPITQYFESARHAGLLRYSAGDGERDLYGDDLKMANVNVMMTTAAVSHPKVLPFLPFTLEIINCSAFLQLGSIFSSLCSVAFVFLVLPVWVFFAFS